MKEKIERAIHGNECPKCGSDHPPAGGHKDERFKCGQCGYKYSPKKLKDDLAILHYFSLEIPANKTARDLEFSYGKVRRKYMQYRQEICDYLEQEFSKLSGEIECDESYFGGKRKGNRGRGAQGKVTVFGMLERKGKIYTTLVDDVSAETLMNEIKKHAEKGSVFYSANWRIKSYKSLTFYGKHITVDHGSYFANGRRHINGLEGFWSFAKERFLKYHGVSKKHFLTYLKEMEFRYNYRKENLFHFLINIHFGPVLS